MILLLIGLGLQAPARDSLPLLARRLPEAALVDRARDHPLEVREALRTLLEQADLGAARKLAGAYAVAWRDSFLLREVTRFAGWRPEQRARKLRADSLRGAGIEAWSREGPLAAIVLWRRGVESAMSLGDTAGMAALLGNIGAGFARVSQLDSAIHYLERSREFAAAQGNLRVEANALAELAGVSEQQGELGLARDGYARAAVLRQRTGDSRGLAADYNNIAGLAQRAGDLDEARRQLEAALALNRRDGRSDVAATNLVNLAGLAALAGDFAKAESLYRASLGIWRARRQWTDVADAQHGLGQLEIRRGDYPAAQRVLAQALAGYRKSGLRAQALEVERELASVLAAVGDLQGALDRLRHAQRQADSTHAGPSVRAGISLARADLAWQLNATAEAERLYAAAELLSRGAGNPDGEVAAEEGRARVLLARGSGDAAPFRLFGPGLAGHPDLDGERVAFENRCRHADLAAEIRHPGAVNQAGLHDQPLGERECQGARRRAPLEHRLARDVLHVHEQGLREAAQVDERDDVGLRDRAAERAVHRADLVLLEGQSFPDHGFLPRSKTISHTSERGA